MKKLLVFFVVITFVNVVVFFFRSHFQYIEYTTYEGLYGACDRDCQRKWGDFVRPYPASSIAEARHLLAAVPVYPDSTLFNLKKIGQHFYQSFHRQAGYPGAFIHSAEPVVQYQILSADTTQRLWCGTWAQMLTFFGWSHNIVSRNVEIMQPGDHHVLNEFYLPEQKKWVMVDLTNNILLVQKDGRLLNTQDFVQLLSQPKTLTVLTGEGTMEPLVQLANWPQVRQYYQAKFDFHYYHVTHPDAVYSTSAKIRRYFLPDSWYEILPHLPK